jgi:hypothetical protein
MKRKALKTKVQTGLLPGFDNWDIFAPAGALLLTAYLVQKITGNNIIQILIPVAMAAATFMLRMWLKDNFPPKHLIHWFNWMMSSDILLPSADPNPTPLVIAMPERRTKPNQATKGVKNVHA